MVLPKEKAEYMIHVVEMGADWVIFQAGKPVPPADQLASLLNKAFTEWQSDNRHCKVRCANAITANGSTFAIHVWFDKE